MNTIHPVNIDLHEAKKSIDDICIIGSCGVESNADTNAAKNILGRGVAEIRKREALACA
jgi:hypothetical protein